MGTTGEVSRGEFRTTDMSEACEFLDDAYGWRLDMHRAGAAGAPLVVSNADAGTISCGHADAPGDMSYRVEGGGFVVLDTLFAGAFELEHVGGAEQYGPGDVFVANHPQAAFTSKTHDIRVLTTTLPASLLTEVSGAAPDAAVEFDSYTPVSDGSRRRWWQLSQYVDDLVTNTADPSPLAMGPAARLLAATALDTFPNSLAPRERPSDRTDATSATLDRAIAFVETNAGRDIGLADIAAAAYVSPRAVQLAFRRKRDTTPMRYLRRVRLARARHALMVADPSGGVNVTAIATEWGFTHVGRFATAYRAAYGELPSVTLGRR